MDSSAERSTIEDEIKQLIELSQDSTACHQRYSILMKRLLDKDKSVVDILLKCIGRILLKDYKSKNIYIERIIQFIAMFCASLKPLVVQQIFNFLLESQCLINDSVRYWSCKLIGKVFENAEEISDDLFERIKEGMVDRIKDPKSAVRFQAINSLFRLQEPEDKHDVIIESFLDTLEKDPNGKVRQLCLEKIVITKKVLPVIIDRARDVDASVRLTAYKRLADLVCYLTISQRRTLIKCGFLDSSDKVKAYVLGDFLQKWLEKFDNNYLKLIKSLRLDADEKDIEETNLLVELVLGALFKKKSLNDIPLGIDINSHKMIDYERLNWETAVYWRILIQYLRRSEEYDHILDVVIPELIYFCKYIEGYERFARKEDSGIDCQERNFVLKQLFLITIGYDVSDSTLRRCLNLLVRHMLGKCDLKLDTAETIVNNLEITIVDTEERSRFVCEIISDVMCPFDENAYNQSVNERNFQIATHKTALNIQQEELSIAIAERKFADAERLQTAVHELQMKLQEIQNVQVKEEIDRTTDEKTILKYLNIAEALLKSPRITSLTPSLETLKCDVIQEVLMHENDDIKSVAFRCYALCSIVDLKTAKCGIHIFSTPIFAYHNGEECNTQILIACIHAVIDLLRIYGSSLIAEPNDELNDSRREEHVRIFTGGTSLTDLIQGLVDLMDAEECEIQESATKGLCSLLTNNRVHSASLIARLVLKWCNPATDEEIKQYIGLTLNTLPKLPDCASYFVDATVIIVKTLVYAPKNSPLVDVNVDNIAKFMLNLCLVSSEGRQIHTQLVFKIFDQIKSKPRAKVNLIYSKMILLTSLTDDTFVLEDLKQICDDLRNDVREKQVSNNLIKFNTMLHKIISKPTDLEPIEE